MAGKYHVTAVKPVSVLTVFVQDSIYDTLAEHLVEAVSKLKVGDGRPVKSWVRTQ